MISFEFKDHKFNYRAVAIIRSNDSVLLHKFKHDGVWSLPGGRVEFGESANESVERELFEELGVKVKSIEPKWVVDNIYQYQGENFQELGIYFLVQLKLDSHIFREKEFRGIEPDVNIWFKWFHLDQLGSIGVYPEFLVDGLKNMPEGTEYIVNRAKAKGGT